MKTYSIIYLACLLVSIQAKVDAQNLVTNPSFEITNSNCTLATEIFDTDLYGTWDNGDDDLSSDSCSSPDLFTACNLYFTNVPNAITGFQHAHSGSRFVGLITYVDGAGDENYREYIQGRLTQPLMADSYYHVSMYVSLADSALFATNNLGIHFTSTHISRNTCPAFTNSILKVPPHLNFSGVITDTSDAWYQLEWNYKASGGERFFMIGNFLNFNHTTVIPTGFHSGLWPPLNVSYYYIDDVSITQICMDSIVFKDIGKPGCDTAIGTLTAEIYPAIDSAGYSFIWNTGAAGQVVDGLTSGTYTVSATNNQGCAAWGSYNLQPSLRDSVGTTSSPTICGDSSGSALITINSALSTTYQWSNGSSTAELTNLAEGIYAFTVSFVNGCIFEDSIDIFCISDTVSKIPETNKETRFVLLPNPASNTLTVEGPYIGPMAVSIYNITAELVFAVYGYTNSQAIDVSTLANGIYIAEIKCADLTVRKKWIKL